MLHWLTETGVRYEFTQFRKELLADDIGTSFPSFRCPTVLFPYLTSPDLTQTTSWAGDTTPATSPSVFCFGRPGKNQCHKHLIPFRSYQFVPVSFTQTGFRETIYEKDL
jgi:hypothetical protein